jgi:aminopeptidase C
MEMFSYLHSRQLELFQINFDKIILLPKVNGVERIQQYRPICLLNVSFKIFTKTTINRLNMWLTMWFDQHKQPLCKQETSLMGW